MIRTVVGVIEHRQPEDSANSDGGLGEEQPDTKMEEDQQQLSDGEAPESESHQPIISPVSPVAQEKEQSPDPQPDLHSNMQSESVDGEQDLDVWRLGQQHPKARFLLLRPARTGETKGFDCYLLFCCMGLNLSLR